MKTTLALILAAVVAAAAAGAATDLPCDGVPIVGHWTVDGSPYLVNCDITIASLVIDPGVEVLATGDYSVTVDDGQLTAVGTEAQPILFSRQEGVAGWKGLRLINASSGSELAWCTIEKSTYRGLYVETAVGAMPWIHHCRIADNHRASGWATEYAAGVAANGDLVLEDCVIENNSSQTDTAHWTSNDCYGGGIYVNGTLQLVRCRVQNNTVRSYVGGYSTGRAWGGGICVFGALLLDNSHVTGNTAFAHNSFGGPEQARGGGVYACGELESRNSVVADNQVTSDWRRGGGIYHDCGSAVIVNSTIADNSSQGLYSDDAGGTCEIASSIIWNNETPVAGVDAVTYTDIEGGYEGEGNISCTPIFDGDYRILPGSCCIDAGDPAPESSDTCFPPSQGSLHADMGWTGGPGAYAHGLPRLVITDVPDDQGGQVTVSWPRFAADDAGAADPITAYTVELGPLAFTAPNDDWTEVATIAADESPTYSVVVPVDSTYVVDESWPFHVVRVVGAAATPTVSNTNLALAVDNLPPAPPSLGMSENVLNRLILIPAYDHPEVPDLGRICVYRGGWNRPEQVFLPTEATLWNEAIEMGGDCDDPMVACVEAGYTAPAMFLECHRSMYYYIARAIDVHGNSSAASDSVYSVYPTGVGDDPPVAAAGRLASWPNPFNPLTTIEYVLTRPSPVEITVFDVRGRQVVRLVSESEVEAGRHQVVWRGRDERGRAVASGSYLCLLSAGDVQLSHRLVLLR